MLVRVLVRKELRPQLPGNFRSGAAYAAAPVRLMQVIGGALRVRGCYEDRPVIALQHLERGCEIGRVIVARLGSSPRSAQRNADPSSGNQLLGGVTFCHPSARLTARTVAF